MKTIYLLLSLSFLNLNAQERIKVNYTETIIIDYTILRKEQLYIDLKDNKTVWVQNASTEKEYDSNEPIEKAPQEVYGNAFTATLGRTIPNDYILYDFKNKEIEIIQDLGKRVFSVKDSFIINKWDLQKESKMVNGIECFKASTTFRGNDWEVWYAPSLPYPYGPWKLNGLPGLILEAKSTDGYYTYIAEKIENDYKTNELVIPRDKILKEISFREYLEYQDYLFNDLFLGKNAPPPEDIFARDREKKFEIKANLSWLK